MPTRCLTTPARREQALQQEARFGAAFLRRHGWRLALLFAGVLLPLWGFAELADEVREQEGFVFDDPLLLRRQRHGALGLRPAVPVASPRSATSTAWCRSTSRWCCVLAFKRRLREGLFAGIALVGSALLNLAAKQFFARDRPSLWESIAPEDNFSFPSGHAMGSMTLALVLVLLAWPTRWRWPVLVAMAVFVAAGRPVARLPGRALPVRHPRRLDRGVGVDGGRVPAGVSRAFAAVAGE